MKTAIMNGITETERRRKARLWLKESHGTLVALAERWGCTPQRVGQVLNGKAVTYGWQRRLARAGMPDELLPPITGNGTPASFFELP